jgi:hypothetical protein
MQVYIAEGSCGMSRSISLLKLHLVLVQPPGFARTGANQFLPNWNGLEWKKSHLA